MAKHPLTALVPHLRDELATDERIRVTQHLEECAECRVMQDSLAEASAELVRRIERTPALDPLVYRAQLVRKLASHQAAKERSWRPGFAWVAIAAAGASAIALILILRIHSHRVVPSVEELATESEISDAGIGLLRDYPLVTHLDLLENYDLIEHLNELPEADNQQHAARA
jgi:anti-sigma factor RsiW